MAIIAQVAVEYGALASDRAADTAKDDSVGSLVERISNAVPTEYVVIGIAGLVVIYIIKKVYDALN